jgi:hypothetical protein
MTVVLLRGVRERAESNLLQLDSKRPWEPRKRYLLSSGDQS